MIISHARKFIFVKTKKTAGTSLEIALSRACEPGDIITDLSERQMAQFRDDKINSIVAHKPRFRMQQPNKIRDFMYKEHSNIFHAFMVFKEQLKEYTIITVERNPWEKVISQYYYQLNSRFGEELPFKQFVLGGQFVTDFVLYSMRGIPVFDYCLRQEHLEEDLEQLRGDLDLPQEVSISDIQTKTEQRPRDDKSSRASLYECEMLTKMVESAFAPELYHFGYRYDQKGCDPIAAHPGRFAARNMLIDRAERQFAGASFEPTISA